MLELDLQRATDAAAPDDAAFRRWCELALRQRTADSEMTIRLVDEPEGRELNHTYRHKDYATNVLSFPADVPDDLLDIPCWATWSFACQWSSGKPPSKASRSKPTGRTGHPWLPAPAWLRSYRGRRSRGDGSPERTLLAELGHPDPYADDEITQPDN